MDEDGTPRNDALACFEFARVMKPGDFVLAKKGRSKIVGYGTIIGDYEYDSSRPYYRNTRKVRWEGRGEWTYNGNLVMKTVTDISKYPSHVEELKTLIGLVEEVGPEPTPAAERTPYSVHDALDGLFLSEGEFQELLVLWRHKKNLILQGAPGVGKTFIARRLAYALMGYRDPSRLEMVQFHQSYSYEDFIQGYRPSGEGFALKNGSFYTFCERARHDQDNRYVFIIDEINRGNLSKIFGELLMLIESDKRGSEWSVPLTYAMSTEVQFYVPENLYLLGLMNTADRSLAVVDYALRRRFAFKTLTPKYQDDKFRAYHAVVGVPKELTDRIVSRMSELNSAIASDTVNLGPGFQIGHSFFTPALDQAPFDEGWYRRIVETEIVPLLEEYWFEDSERVAQWRHSLLE
jgi:5-methylcytosine-specific restriction protein B